MIAMKREVAVQMNGFSVERMSRGLIRPVNLATSHCTNTVISLLISLKEAKKVWTDYASVSA